MEHGAGEAAGWLLALQDSQLGAAMRQSLLLYPAVEIVHLVGLALLVGGIAAMDLRLIGLSGGLPASGLAWHLLPLAIGGFALSAASGLALFTSDAVSLAGNPAFLMKLGLIGLAGANAAALHLGPWRRAGEWAHARPPAPVRWAGALSLALWLAVLSCGRLIAYV